MFYEEKQQRLIDLYKDLDKEDSSFPENRNQQVPLPDSPTPVKQDITDNTSSTEKKKKSRRSSLRLIEFDYESNQFTGILKEDLDDWEKIYEGVDIAKEISKMRNWLMDPKNPERDGSRTFINNWLARAAKEVAKTPRKPKVEEAPSNPSGNDIPYNSSIAYSILHRDGEAAYVDYLKAVNEQKYFNNYLDGKYEQNYIDYVSEKGIE
jgi:hypothetical protein